MVAVPARNLEQQSTASVRVGVPQLPLFAIRGVALMAYDPCLACSVIGTRWVAFVSDWLSCALCWQLCRSPRFDRPQGSKESVCQLQVGCCLVSMSNL
jgi:hypothetical protein